MLQDFEVMINEDNEILLNDVVIYKDRGILEATLIFAESTKDILKELIKTKLGTYELPNLETGALLHALATYYFSRGLYSIANKLKNLAIKNGYNATETRG